MPITDFPQAGGDRPVSLANSQWDVFDVEYAQDLRDNWPSIWSRGGNVRGNEQYRKLAPIARRRDKSPQDGTEENAIRLREAWGARHLEDFQLPGVVAQIKWLVVGSRGERHMKDVIEEAKESLGRSYTKAALVETKAADGQQVYTFRVTSEAVDRQGEVISADSWDFGSFESNPVVLDTHDYSGIEAIVGRVMTPLRRMGDTWEADLVFSDSPKGRLAKQLVDEGSLRAVSVGFRSLQRVGGARESSPLTHTKAELLEISVVPIPANPEAVRLRSVEEQAVAAEVIEATKAGRVLSAKNEQSLRQAVDLLAGVLAGLTSGEEKAAGDDAASTAVTELETVEQVTEEAPAQTDEAEDVVAQLRAYLAGTTEEV